jgi:hypothetical protein
MPAAPNFCHLVTACCASDSYDLDAISKVLEVGLSLTYLSRP